MGKETGGGREAVESYSLKQKERQREREIDLKLEIWGEDIHRGT